tara:strand:- start:861 stop:1250 length:390 start_codon:yes stop_codon:yes gene_type:complete
MNNELLLVSFLAFLAGYIFKTITHHALTFSTTSLFVRKMAEELLKLIGTVIYKVSYMDQLYAMAIENVKGKEEAKRARNELQDDFEEWKKIIVQEFREHYPKDFKWQLEFDDWNGVMEMLTDIYKERKV